MHCRRRIRVLHRSVATYRMARGCGVNQLDEVLESAAIGVPSELGEVDEGDLMIVIEGG
jgi:hypothetical protein